MSAHETPIDDDAPRRAGIDRRALLAASAAAGGIALATSASAPFAAAQSPAPPRTERVVVVCFAGGVRTRETFGSADNVPNLKRLAGEGVLYTRMRSSNLGHYGAALSMFTGVAEQRGIRENQRGESPTLFEYLRKDKGLGAGDVWIATSGGAQQTNFSSSVHPQYGPKYGANTLDGDGLFNAELRELVRRWSQPRRHAPEEQALVARLRAAIAGPARASDAPALNSQEGAARVEQYILEELARGTAEITGPNAADAKALRTARNLLAVFRPKLIAVVLQQADVAHGSFNGYAEIVRRNDAALGELAQAIRDDPELARTTALLVAPEFGRDRDLNSRRGLDHGDGSDDLNFVSGLAVGPEFRRGQVVDEEVAVVDVCTTVCALLGAEAKHARGRKLPKLLA